MPEPLSIVGAGPVGSLLALTLARRGHDVVVYERRPDMRRVEVSGGRSINLGLSTRGLHALRAVGLDSEASRDAVAMRGRVIHPRAGALIAQSYDRDGRGAIASMSRAGLNRILMNAAEATGRVGIRFQRRLVRYSFESRRATFRDEASGALDDVDAPIVFGADGSASALRAALADRAAAEVHEDALDCGYKELTMPALPGGQRGAPRFALEPGALHIWPRGTFMLVALPNVDGSFTCTIFLPLEAPHGGPSFAGLRDAASVTELFAESFADVALLIPDLAEAFLSAPLGRVATVKVWPWSRGAALLLGDAAHAMAPFLGQGLNAGFEDCTRLARALEGARLDSEFDWAQVFEAFARDRKPDTDAVCDLAAEHYMEMRDKVADPRFALEKAVEAELARRHPSACRSRHQLVTFTRVPYRVAAEAGRVMDGILRDVCAGASRAEQVDYDRAGALVAERLAPLLRGHGL